MPDTMRGRKVALFLVSLLAVAAGLRVLSSREPLPERATPLSHHVYVWQRLWTGAVTNALLSHRSRFSNCIVLNAEIGWQNGKPALVEVPLDFACLRQTRAPIGLALRIGPYPGPFGPEASATRLVCETAKRMVTRARAEQVQISELHVDFDCAEAKLKGYRRWIDAIQRAVPDVPISITALPSWLKHRTDFSELIEPLSGYVLQVHSLERPQNSSENLALCDSEAALRAVAKASRFGKGFAVALPTYGYRVAYDPSGKFAGLRAEGEWTGEPGHTVREVQSSPSEMAQLVRHWSERSPAELEGIIWYRLPTADDELNWRWATLEQVMQGQTPATNLRSEVRAIRPGLAEAYLRNTGSAEFHAPVRLRVTYKGRLLAGDGLNNFQFGREANCVWWKRDSVRVAAGSEMKIGWLRMAKPLEANFETHLTHH